MRLKSMIYLTLSYVPWVTYWTLSAMKLKFGTILMFIIGVLLVITEIIKKEVSIMDVTAVAYSIVAIIFTYILKSNLFIEADGYLGYGILFCMGLISRILKKPFMMFYVKKDIKNFTKKTNVINSIWTVIFAIDTLIFYFIKMPMLAVISSNVFVIIGIITSLTYINKRYNIIIEGISK